jgi:hypothetical protein
MTRLANGFLCIVCLMLTACATQTGLNEGLDQSVKSYNKMLRWHEIENAVLTYCDSNQRDESLKQAAALKKRGLSVTDFRIISKKYITEKKTGDVVAEFDYYILPSNKINTISNRQEWVYEESSKSWKLKCGLPKFE